MVVATETVQLVKGKRKIQESKTEYRQILQGLPTAIYSCDAQGRITLYNKAAVNIWGREPEIGRDLWCGAWRIYRTDGTPLPLDQCPMARTIQEGRSITEEVVIERPDGIRHYVEPHPQPIFDNSGKVIGAVNVLIDITRNRQTEQALRESEARFRKVADTAPAMIWMADAEKCFVFFNKGWLTYTGQTIEKERGNGWTLGIHKDDLQRCVNTYISSFDARKEFYIEYRFKNYCGEYRWVSNKGIPRYNPSGVFEGYIGSCWDIHNKIMASADLEKKVEERTKELKRAKEELEQFTYISSHDLQEPLRKIDTFSELLTKKTDSTDPDINKYIERIRSCSRHMSVLIKDLLSFSYLDKTEEKFAVVDLNKILEDVKKDFEIVINDKKAIICSSKLPVVKAMPLQINQLLYNLISNALKFSGENPIIDISVKEILPGKMPEYLQLNPNLKYLQLIVTDNGIGFKQEYDKKIFTIFQRLNDRQKYSGTGIGLAICKKIAENHQGVITATGKPGEGATFNVYLPFDIQL